MLRRDSSLSWIPLCSAQSCAGPLAVAAGAENQAFLNSALASSGLDRPDTQAFLVSLSLATKEGEVASKFLGVKQEVYDRYYKPNRDKNSFMIVPIVLRPASRGRVTLKSARYTDHPIIDPRYFSDPRDLQTAIEGTKEAMKVLETAPMRALGVERWNLTMPGCEDKKLWSDDYIACLAMQLTETAWHFASTCPMGEGVQAVVDARLR
ncbi:glucose dehydrogenase [FAD, quinone]-like [Ornithodoros turicata]|uniref:glucose dehydrogenase [FAD, quinone]-like n=1 Tax=Ornithodoros turicata TaxID=34597 RepID=UPI003138BA53